MDDEAAIVAQICKAIVELEVADMSLGKIKSNFNLFK